MSDTTAGLPEGRERRTYSERTVALLEHFANGPLTTDVIGTFDGHNFANKWVAMVGDLVCANRDEPFRFDTSDEAATFGARFQAACRTHLAEAVR